jgi:uncharacterized protein
VVFKRRRKRSLGQTFVNFFYPKGGWRRAASYVLHRLRRLPDSPERIGRGVAAGVFASFTPLFGLHFILAALVARAMQGNILAALLSTFFGNPVTFPIIVMVSVELGNRMLGQPGVMHFPQIMSAFGLAWVELWDNMVALLTGQEPHWDRLALFFRRVFLPYLVGGIAPGVITATVMYFVTLPLIRAYQNRRRKKLRERFERVRQAIAERDSQAAPKEPDDAGGVER